ncbi:hypothetical protein OH799_01360 [Nocardia sp. NBC_00881]|uniref:hypothetical protein n=1 Tax=Nocardia sp. NBC_00881 TaxID=2975995 RepID=UPI00386AB229|nr:hypothetical protein OH799_01360 [Nocardia sp. NBC_00881]
MSDPATPARPPVPMRLAHQPVSQGLVVPHITLAHRDRSRPVWGKVDPERLWDTFSRKLCQICGQGLGDRVVLFIRPADYLHGLAVEPGCHPECGRYSSRACPMLAARQNRYNPHPRERFNRCSDPACNCWQWRASEPDPREAPREGQPAEAWYEASISIAEYSVIHDPGTADTPPAVGINLRGVELLKLRKVRDAAPAADRQSQPVDLLASIVAVRALFGESGELS